MDYPTPVLNPGIFCCAHSLDVCFRSKPMCEPDSVAHVGHIGCYVWIWGGALAQWAASSLRNLLAVLKSLSSSSLSSDFISSCFRLCVAISAACFFLHLVLLFWNHTWEKKEKKILMNIFDHTNSVKY